RLERPGPSRPPGRRRSQCRPRHLRSAQGTLRRMNFDPRITAARPDLAAAELEGKVSAARFVAGEKKSVARGRAPLHVAPDRGSGRETELLFGEIFTVYEDKDGWCW